MTVGAVPRHNPDTPSSRTTPLNIEEILAEERGCCCRVYDIRGVYQIRRIRLQIRIDFYEIQWLEAGRETSYHEEALLRNTGLDSRKRRY
jgi:hypothetical protein